MSTFGWFGMNQHLERPRVTDVVDEILGVPRGTTVEHGDGRRDAVVRSRHINYSPEEAEGLFELPLNDIRRLVYDYRRDLGDTHEDALKRLGTRKLKV